MNTQLEQLEPRALWTNFKHLCSVPHPSKHESQIRDLIVAFLKDHHLTYQVDAVGNILVQKPATPGLENRKTVILQAHIDMVPQANSDKNHDFTKDPIEAYIDGEWVTANGTTLGADNGIGVAAIMSVLENTQLKHGPIEVLLTVDEETGMGGANGLESGVLKGDILINMDSEDEGELYVGCAGGIDANIKIAYTMEALPADHQVYQVVIRGLKGGHSGMDIILGRANANKVFFRYMQKITQQFSARLSDIQGGSLRNAIPREAFASIAIPNIHKTSFESFTQTFVQTLKAEFSAVEPTFDFIVEAGSCKQVMLKADQDKVINVVRALPNGVMRMSDAMPGLVETSTNLAIVKSNEGQVNIACLLRSSVDSAKEALAEMMVSICELAQCSIELSGAYPGWKPNMTSPILKTMQEVYQQHWNKTPKIAAVHAGLECGILGSKYPHWDMISFGPTIRFPHSPDEKVEIKSVALFWEYLVATLENIPQK